MKPSTSLHILFLWAVVSLLIAAQMANAVAYCTSSAIDTTTIAPTTITSQTATGCTLSANSKLSFTGTSIPSKPTLGIVEITFVGGTIATGGFIQITGPTAATASTRVPFVVLVSKNNFGNGAAVLVTGSYPPDSNITISYNTFVSSLTCAQITWIVTAAFVLVIAYVDVVPIVLYERAEINSQYNNIDTNSGTNHHSIPFEVNAITFYANASARIKGNTIKTHGALSTTGNTWVILFDYGSYVYNTQTPAYFRYYGGGGRWEFDDNWMQATTNSPHIAYVGNSPTIVDAPQGGTYSISRNYFKAVPISDSVNPANPCFGASGGNVGTNFNYLFIGNTLDVYNFGNYMQTMGIDVAGNSRAIFSDNIFRSVNANAGFYVLFSSTSIRGTSQLIVANNKFITVVGAAKYHALQMVNGFGLGDSTTFTAIGNSIDAATRTSTYKLYTMSSPSLSAASRITVCDTRYFGTRLSKFSFKNAADAAFVAMPIQYCKGTRTQSATWTLTQTSTKTITVSISLSASHSQSQTQTRSLTATSTQSLTQSLSSTLSPSISGTVSATQSLSSSQTATHSTSPSQTRSDLISKSKSMALTSSETAQVSKTHSESLTLSATKSRESSISLTTTTTLSPTASSTQSLSPSASTSNSNSFSSSTSISKSYHPTKSQSPQPTKSRSDHPSKTLSTTTSATSSFSASTSLPDAKTASHFSAGSSSIIASISSTGTLEPPPTAEPEPTSTISNTKVVSLSSSIASSPTMSEFISESAFASTSLSRSSTLPRSSTGSEYQSDSHALSTTLQNSITIGSLSFSHSLGATINTITPQIVPTEAPLPINASTLPPPLILNAPELDDSVNEILFRSATLGGSAAIVYHHTLSQDRCLRLERLLVRSTILTPLYLGENSFVKGYEDVLLLNGMVLIGAGALGLFSTLARWACVEVQRDLGVNRGDEESRLGRAATVVRFPATAIQVFIFLSGGSAVAAGLALSQSPEMIRVIVSIAAIAIILICSILWAAALGRSEPRYVKTAGEDEAATDDGPIRPPKSQDGDGGRRVLVCAEVRPSLLAKRFGPVAGDLRFQSGLASLWPAAVSFALLILSLAMGFLGACEHLPLAAAVAMFVYMVCIILVRPFLGITHNAAEAFWSTAVAACLVILWLAFNKDEHYTLRADDERDEFGADEIGAVLALGCILNCRYPFVLARVLDVTLPKVVSVTNLCGTIIANGKNTKSQAIDEEDSFSILVPDNDNSKNKSKNREQLELIDPLLPVLSHYHERTDDSNNDSGGSSDSTHDILPSDEEEEVRTESEEEAINSLSYDDTEGTESSVDSDLL